MGRMGGYEGHLHICVLCILTGNNVIYLKAKVHNFLYEHVSYLLEYEVEILTQFST